jgi:hypothetical protein
MGMKTMHVMLMGALLVATGMLAACNGDDVSDGAATPSASPSAVETAEPTATPSLEDEVGAAYLQYWDAYSAALLELDVSLAEEFASGEQLQRIREEIDGFRSQGVALRTVVDHDFVVVEASATTATVLDEIVNNSFFVDPVTKDPPTAEGSGETFTDTYELDKVGSRWIVVDGSRLR